MEYLELQNTSLCLSFTTGKKVANVPLVYGSKIPEQLEEIDQRKIFALTINPETLMEIRKKRLERLKASGYHGEYADNSNVIKELEWANDLYRKNKKWVTFNITNKALKIQPRKS